MQNRVSGVILESELDVNRRAKTCLFICLFDFANQRQIVSALDEQSCSKELDKLISDA